MLIQHFVFLLIIVMNSFLFKNKLYIEFIWKFYKIYCCFYKISKLFFRYLFNYHKPFFISIFSIYKTILKYIIKTILKAIIKEICIYVKLYNYCKIKFMIIL